jgi:hypothetical protein
MILRRRRRLLAYCAMNVAVTARNAMTENAASPSSRGGVSARSEMSAAKPITVAATTAAAVRYPNEYCARCTTKKPASSTQS